MDLPGGLRRQLEQAASRAQLHHSVGQTLFAGATLQLEGSCTIAAR